MRHCACDRRSQMSASPSISALMATDSATLTPAKSASRRSVALPKIQSPAEPIARGIGLDRPFFDDKNRAFWVLQSIGWGGYFFLRTPSGIANKLGRMLLVHTPLLNIARYSLPPLIDFLFPRPIQILP